MPDDRPTHRLTLLSPAESSGRDRVAVSAPAAATYLQLTLLDAAWQPLASQHA